MFSSDGPERDLWTVSIGPVSLEGLELVVEPERATATTERPATVRLRVQNPTSDIWILNHGECPEIDTNKPGLILFPHSLEPDFHPEPIRDDCWKPNPESYFYPCETLVPKTKISPGQSWSITHEVWLEEEEDCIPDGSFEFEIFGYVQGEYRGYPDNRLGGFSLVIQPIETTTAT